MLSFSRPLNRSAAAGLYESLAKAEPVRGAVTVDLSAIGKPDAVTLAALIAGARSLSRRSVDLRMTGAPELIAEIDRWLQAGGKRARPTRAAGVMERLTRRAQAEWATMRATITTAVRSLGELLSVLVFRHRMARGSLSTQVTVMGADGVPVVALLGFLLGVILAIEAADQLAALGATSLIPHVVGLSLVREFAPLLTAVVVIGRSGAAAASELASMTVDQEVDALRVTGIDPIPHLVSPRVLSLLIVQPALTLLSIAVGLGGAVLTLMWDIGFSPVLFYDRLIQIVHLRDVVYGLGKSVAFAAATGLASCAVGLNTRGAAADVGRATTRAVVVSIFLLVVIDSLFAFTSGAARL